MKKTIEVALLAESRLLREALIRLLSKKTEISVLGCHSYSPTVHELVIAAHPQIVLLDAIGLIFNEGALLTALRAAIPNLRIIMVDMDSDERTFLRAVRAGVVGYVLKDASATEVVSTIRAVATGQAVCPPALAMTMFRSVAQQAASPQAGSPISDYGLSRRELQMVDLLRERLTNKEIAARLNLSEQTVKNHVHRILRKLGVESRLSIVARLESSLSAWSDYSAVVEATGQTT
jgi:two-component system, NarL family, response regulator DevR